MRIKFSKTHYNMNTPPKINFKKSADQEKILQKESKRKQKALALRLLASFILQFQTPHFLSFIRSLNCPLQNSPYDKISPPS